MILLPYICLTASTRFHAVEPADRLLLVPAPALPSFIAIPAYIVPQALNTRTALARIALPLSTRSAGAASRRRSSRGMVGLPSFVSRCGTMRGKSTLRASIWETTASRRFAVYRKGSRKMCCQFNVRPRGGAFEGGVLTC
jgi:hypothetical protein